MLNWSDYFYYDETSPSCLRHSANKYGGRHRNVIVISKGEVAGTLHPSGYWRVGFNGRSVNAHKIIYELLTNQQVSDDFQIDHRNGIPCDNKIGNLRVVSKHVNARNHKIQSNNKTGVVGVQEHSSGNRSYFVARWNCIETGKRKQKYFNIGVLGREVAFNMAKNCRAEAIVELNELGAGYSDRHGK